MAIDNQKFKPINIFGYIVSTFGIVALIMFPVFFAYNRDFPPEWFLVIGVIQILLFLFGGIGIIMRKIWGYYLLKVILYWLLIAFPIGTLFSVKMFDYIKKNNIRDFFTVKSIEL